MHNAKCETKTPAHELPVVKPGTSEWRNAVNAIKNATKNKPVSDVRVSTLAHAKQLLKEALGNMNKYKQHAHKILKYPKGYEVHQQFKKGIAEGDNALQNTLWHIKWIANRTSGHIFFG